MKTKLETKLIKLCSDLDAIYRDDWLKASNGRELDRYPFHTFVRGRKYIKIIYNETSPNCYPKKSVWGFINYTNPDFNLGDVLKANTWNSPALNKARGNILDGYEITGDRRYSPDYLI